jgi:hypothetical protein
MLSEAQNIRTEFAFQLQDASVRGGGIFISDPTKWQKLEDEHLVSSLVIPAKAGIHDSGDRFPPSRE